MVRFGAAPCHVVLGDERSQSSEKIPRKVEVNEEKLKRFYHMIGGFMYILKCSNGSYYTGSTRNLNTRLEKHQKGIATIFTNKHRPVKLVYFEEFDRVAKAYEREKQIQGWSRAKKEALIDGASNKLKNLAACKNDTHFKNK